MTDLQKYLSINYWFSGVSGLTMLLFGGVLNPFFGVTNEWVFPVIGANLLVFAGFVYRVSRWQSNVRVWVYLVSTLDGIWVVGSLALLLWDPFGLTNQALVLIGLVALWIGFLGFMQIRHFKS